MAGPTTLVKGARFGPCSPDSSASAGLCPQADRLTLLERRRERHGASVRQKLSTPPILPSLLPHLAELGFDYVLAVEAGDNATARARGRAVDGETTDPCVDSFALDEVGCVLLSVLRDWALDSPDTAVLGITRNIIRTTARTEWCGGAHHCPSGAQPLDGGHAPVRPAREIGARPVDAMRWNGRE
ncbi:hypothetical protein [Streptomyces buecherae]|uniref:hypothetical protein n=1 Tax=Streptomyces buecherae TaxID=2763006 RepID=UPI003692B0E1